MLRTLGKITFEKKTEKNKAGRAGGAVFVGSLGGDVIFLRSVDDPL
jgi:hypothetical protein